MLLDAIVKTFSVGAALRLFGKRFPASVFCQCTRFHPPVKWFTQILLAAQVPLLAAEYPALAAGRPAEGETESY